MHAALSWKGVAFLKNVLLYFLQRSLWVDVWVKQYILLDSIENMSLRESCLFKPEYMKAVLGNSTYVKQKQFSFPSTLFLHRKIVLPYKTIFCCKKWKTCFNNVHIFKHIARLRGMFHVNNAASCAERLPFPKGYCSFERKVSHLEMHIPFEGILHMFQGYSSCKNALHCSKGYAACLFWIWHLLAGMGMLHLYWKHLAYSAERVFC